MLRGSSVDALRCGISDPLRPNVFGSSRRALAAPTRRVEVLPVARAGMGNGKRWRGGPSDRFARLSVALCDRVNTNTQVGAVFTVVVALFGPFGSATLWVR